MRMAEKNLLVAVRNALRTDHKWSERECEIELDEMAPATVGDLYVAVLPGGWRPGPRHNTSGGVNDLVYGVDVLVVKRVRSQPRDRMRDVFLHNLDSLDRQLDDVHESIDWSYEVMNAANELIAAETGSAYGFSEPLRFAAMEKRPRPAPAELFGSAQTTPAGLMRAISFGGARRLSYK